MSYELNQYESRLIQSSTDISQLSILQRNTTTRLQFFVHHKKHFIKSTQDQFQPFRIVILSILIKIFEQFSDQNNNRLETLKSIIYSSTLQKLVKDFGLLKEQLHKLVAVQLHKMQTGFEAESYLLNMFNCVAFFDQILIRSFQEKFKLKTQLDQLQNLESIIKQKFQIQILWNKENLENQTGNQIYLWKENNKILRQSALNMTFIGESSSQGSAHNSTGGGSKRRKRTKSKTVLLQTVSINDSHSPFLMDSNIRKEGNLRFQNQIITGFQHGHLSKSSNKFNKNPKNDSEIHLIKNEKKKTLWDILCCSSDS